ncbi:hypothetical protein H4R18_005932, partial [Coemansia javaensis]
AISDLVRAQEKTQVGRTLTAQLVMAASSAVVPREAKKTLGALGRVAAKQPAGS